MCSSDLWRKAIGQIQAAQQGFFGLSERPSIAFFAILSFHTGVLLWHKKTDPHSSYLLSLSTAALCWLPYYVNRQSSLNLPWCYALTVLAVAVASNSQRSIRNVLTALAATAAITLTDPTFQGFFQLAKLSPVSCTSVPGSALCQPIGLPSKQASVAHFGPFALHDRIQNARAGLPWNDYFGDVLTFPQFKDLAQWLGRYGPKTIVVECAPSGEPSLEWARCTQALQMIAASNAFGEEPKHSSGIHVFTRSSKS